MWRIFIEFISNTLFPERCLGCHRYGVALCEKCIADIPLSLPLEQKNLFAVFEYGSKLVQDIIWKCKYHSKTKAFEILSKAAVPYITSYIAEQIISEDTIPIIFVPIPQRKTKTNLRGFNQSALACNILSAQFPNSKVIHVLEKTRDTLPQARIHSRTERLRNVTHSMQLSPTTDLRDMKRSIYIIVDDVTTTGATLLEAIRALHEAGIKHIFGIAIAHGYKK